MDERKKEKLVGREVIARALSLAAVDTVFTVAGGHFLPTYHALGQLGQIKVVAARHEQGAGYMASGYALVTGRPGVVFSGAPGPGATNLVTAVANAYADSIPLIVLSAQVDRRFVHRNILQYCDNVSLFEPFCKRSIQAVSVEEVPNLLATSLQLSVSGRPGPVHVALPQNLQVESVSPPEHLVAVSPRPCIPSEVDIESICEAIANSKRPAILAGHGVLRAAGSSALKSVAECIGAPVATSRSGIGAIETEHPLSVGMLGFYGTDASRESIAQADLVLVVGCALGEQTTFGWRKTLFSNGAKVLQIDADPSQINRTYAVDKGIICDAGTFLASLLKSLGSKETWYARRPIRTSPQNNPDHGLSAARVMEAINFFSSDDTIVSADIGNHRLWVCEQLDIKRPEGLLQSCEFDAMGFSLPAAIGAAVALPNVKVLTISGDGGFVHTMGELAVAKELGLPLVAIVFVDGALGILKHQAEEFYGEHHFVKLQPIKFETIAEAMGVEAKHINDTSDIEGAMGWAMKSQEPVLLSFSIDPGEVFPPLRTKIEQRKIDLLGK